MASPINTPRTATRIVSPGLGLRSSMVESGTNRQVISIASGHDVSIRRHNEQASLDRYGGDNANDSDMQRVRMCVQSIR